MSASRQESIQVTIRTRPSRDPPPRPPAGATQAPPRRRARAPAAVHITAPRPTRAHTHIHAPPLQRTLPTKNTPQVLSKVASLKADGNKAFAKRDYSGALEQVPVGPRRAAPAAPARRPRLCPAP